MGVMKMPKAGTADFYVTIAREACYFLNFYANVVF